MKKISLIVLSFITIICCLCACGNSSSQSTNNQPSTSNKTTASDVSESGSKSSQGDTVVVPNVVGKDVAEATKELEGLGLKYKPKFKRLQAKEFSGENIIYYDDNSVIEQSHKNGTVVVRGTEIEIVINQNISEMKYVINNDNTITFTKLGDTLYYPDRKFYIPKEYDGYKVSHVDSDMLNDFLNTHTSFDFKYYIPQDVIINGSTSAEIIRY